MTVTEVFWLILVVFAIASYFISRFILERGLSVSKHVNLYAVLGALFIFPIVYVVSALIFFSIYFYDFGEPEIAFSSSKWQLDSEGRHMMVNDIIESKILVKRSKGEVYDLLGSPTNDTSSSSWIYDTGFSNGGGFSIEFHSLEVTFENREVVNVESASVID